MSVNYALFWLGKKKVFKQSLVPVMKLKERVHYKFVSALF
jgi:hypothetical protein